MQSVAQSNHRRRQFARGAILACLCAVAVASLAMPSQAAEMKEETKESLKRATVMVFTAMTQNTKGDKPLGSGSGYFINRTGLFITNNHVIDPMHRRSQADKQQFHYRAGRLVWTCVVNSGTEEEETYEAMRVYQNEWADQAIMQAYVGTPEEDEKLQTPDFMPLLPESRMREGMPVWTLGFPGGDNRATVQGEHPEVSITTGKVLGIPRTPGGRIQLIYVDSLARPGNSGGPCVSAEGFVIGTLTIMASPEGRDDAGGADGAGLVPATLTNRFIQYAYEMGKMPPGSDPTPFMRALANEDGRIEVPEYPRLDDQDVVVYPNGDRIYGQITTDTIDWLSPLGEVEVPTDAIAYVMNDVDGAKLFLEGGNLLKADEVGSTFNFRPKGGSAVEVGFDDVKVVGFRTKGRSIQPVRGDVVVFDTDSANLTLSEADAKVKFAGVAGELSFPLEDIQRITTLEDEGSQVVTLQDGRRMTGNFVDEPFSAVVASTGMPIKLSLAPVQDGVIEDAYEGVSDVRGINLMALMAPGDRDIRRIARDLEQNKFDTAWTSLKQLTGSKKYRKFSELKREQLAILQAVAHLREGKFDEARSAFRKAARGKDTNIVAFANAFIEVLKTHPDNKFNEKSLNDRATFAEAGVQIAEKNVAKAQNLLRDYRKIADRVWLYEKGLQPGEYMRNRVQVKRLEKELMLSGVLGGIDADRELIRLYKFAVDLADAEILRLQREGQQMQEEEANRGGRGAPRRATGSRGRATVSRLDREMRKIADQIEEIAKFKEEYEIKLYKSGFRIQDPDIDRERDKDRSDLPDGP